MEDGGGRDGESRLEPPRRRLRRSDGSMHDWTERQTQTSRLKIICSYSIP